MPDLSYENQYEGIVAGVDEAGRGPWAGPVVAAAVVLDPLNFPIGLNDSKKLSVKRREELYDLIIDKAQVGIGIVEESKIDEINILEATKLAMFKAVNNLPEFPEVALIDGNQPPKLSCKVEAVIKGDSKSLSIAAASIIAKVTRDKIMKNLHEVFPQYGWDRNSGYGTKEHQEKLVEFGPTPYHRESFAPIRALLEEKKYG